MKKIFYFAALTAIAAGCWSCQDPNNEITVADSFPKMHLMEHFTTEKCGYCPDGMECLDAYYEKNAATTVWVSHHQGYGTDEFSLSGSKTLMNLDGVEGAPAVAFDRMGVKYKYNGRTYSSTNDKPAFTASALDELVTKLDETTYVSIQLDVDYNAASNQATIHVKGYNANKDVNSLMLTVLIKESGMIGKQADYTHTFNDWKEFVHTNAVRTFVTASRGDEITFKNQKYDLEFNVEIAEKWVPENCMVVAYLSETANYRPIVQAAETPLVKGTKGGSDIKHGGVTPNPVPATYPEEAGQDFKDAWGSNTLEMVSCGIFYQGVEDGLTQWIVEAYGDQELPLTLSGTNYVFLPYAQIICYTNGEIPSGTFEISANKEAGKVLAGYANVQTATLEGSQIMTAEKTYLANGQLAAYNNWLLKSGTMTIGENSFVLEAQTVYPYSVKLTYSGEIRMPSNNVAGMQASHPKTVRLK